MVWWDNDKGGSWEFFLLYGIGWLVSISCCVGIWCVVGLEWGGWDEIGWLWDDLWEEWDVCLSSVFDGFGEVIWVRSGRVISSGFVGVFLGVESGEIWVRFCIVMFGWDVIYYGWF